MLLPKAGLLLLLLQLLLPKAGLLLLLLQLLLPKVGLLLLIFPALLPCTPPLPVPPSPQLVRRPPPLNPIPPSPPPPISLFPPLQCQLKRHIDRWGGRKESNIDNDGSFVHNQTCVGKGASIDNDNKCISGTIAMHTIHDEDMSIQMSI
jgi:hypothetical protein